MPETDHSLDQHTKAEPAGGWVTSPTLLTNEILSLTLCKFTGERVSLDGECPARMERHPDVTCATLFHNGEALARGEIAVELLAPEASAPPGGEVTYRDPVK